MLTLPQLDLLGVSDRLVAPRGPEVKGIVRRNLCLRLDLCSRRLMGVEADLLVVDEDLDRLGLGLSCLDVHLELLLGGSGGGTYPYSTENAASLSRGRTPEFPRENETWYGDGMGAMYDQLAGASTVGGRIRRLLDAQGMTLSDLSRQSGIAKGYLWELVQGPEATGGRMKPSAETLYAVGRVLGASVGDLLGKTIPTPTETQPWPLGLREYVEQAHVPPDEARMLAQINARGRTPTTADRWKILHQTIQTMAEGQG